MFLTLILIIAGCSNRIDEKAYPNNKVLNPALQISVEWPEGQKNNILSAPPSYLNLGTIEVLLISLGDWRQHIEEEYDSSLADYLTGSEVCEESLQYYIAMMLLLTEPEEENFVYNTYSVLQGSEHRDGATIFDVKSGDYLIYIAGLDKDEGITNVFYSKFLTIHGEQTTVLNILAADWIIMNENIIPENEGGEENEDFQSGSGTMADPYIVATAEHLNNVRYYLDSHFRQDAPIIDLNVSPYNVLPGWTPIGDNADPFTGTYDGNGYSIAGMSIETENSGDYGLFGVINGGTVQNLTVTRTSVNGTPYFYVPYATSTGALAGQVVNAIIYNCNSLYNIQGNEYLGGLIGKIDNSTVTNCFTEGGVEGYYYVGGFAGLISNSSVIENSYSVSTVTNEGNYTGGFAGRMLSSTMQYVYATGLTTGSGAGGLVGLSSSGTVTDSYWDKDTTTQTVTSAVGGEAKTTAEMITSNPYPNWDTSIWMFTANFYPVFNND
jgi:hypothetical protein